jgi:PAS domain-containing protein
MFHLEWIWEQQNRKRVLLACAAVVLAIATADWWWRRPLSLGMLYLFPVMFAAPFLPRWATPLLGAGCALLSELFSNLDLLHASIRAGVEALPLCGCGLVAAMALHHRKSNSELQERMRALVETGAFPMVTVDECGAIETANHSAVELLAPRSRQLIGRSIAGFLPVLHYALRWEDRPPFRASMECRGYRENGQPFLAKVWFSGSKEGTVPQLAALIVDLPLRSLRADAVSR